MPLGKQVTDHYMTLFFCQYFLHVSSLREISKLNKILNNKTVPTRKTDHIQDTRLHHRQIHSICLDALIGNGN